MTDGGLTCLDYPDSWRRIAGLVSAKLSDGGIFSARVCVADPSDKVKDKSLERMVGSMTRVDENWMVQPGHPDYAKYNVRYSFPNDSAVRANFAGMELTDMHVPEYEAGSHFVSYAWVNKS